MRFIEKILTNRLQPEPSTQDPAPTTPFHTPNANAFAQRWIRSVRQECLDKLVLLGEWHVRRVLAEYVTFYNTRRPHQGLAQQCPVSLTDVSGEGIVQRRDVLGGIVHDYLRAAA